MNYIHTVLELLSHPENQNFRWNCETWFCVEKFLEEATPQEAQALFEHMKAGRVGFSATYLNFCDLVDSQVLHRRLGEACGLLRARGFQPKTAMCADINGISMGQRDALLDNGIEFLYTNIHCHHGMYPLYQNQTAYWWEAAGGRRLLVWNGEHYNLGNVLGLTPDRHTNGMTANFFGDVPTPESDVEALHQSVESYLTLCEENGYPYDFILASVSGLFHDNAPPNLEILHRIEAYNQRYPQGVQLRMVSLQELYSAIREPLADSPVYRGDLTDWWANGVGSTPYAVKHYREAQRRYALARRLEPQLGEKSPALCRAAEDNLLLYAEHTWGHSSTITNPYDTMVLNLDARKPPRPTRPPPSCWAGPPRRRGTSSAITTLAARHLHGVLHVRRRPGVRVPPGQRPYRLVRCAPVLLWGDGPPSHPPVRQPGGEQPPPGVLLGDEQHLGDQLQNGPLRLWGVPLHLVAQRGDRPPAGHGGAAGALFRALAFDYRLKNEKKAGILYK